MGKHIFKMPNSSDFVFWTFWLFFFQTGRFIEREAAMADFPLPFVLFLPNFQFDFLCFVDFLLQILFFRWYQRGFKQLYGSIRSDTFVDEWWWWFIHENTCWCWWCCSADWTFCVTAASRFSLSLSLSLLPAPLAPRLSWHKWTSSSWYKGLV